MRVRFRKFPFVILATLIIALALTSSLWLGALGAFLIHADQPAAADYAVVLAGDPAGNRVIEGAEMARRGLVRKVLVDDPGEYDDAKERELAVDFAVKKGYPKAS